MRILSVDLPEAVADWLDGEVARLGGVELSALVTGLVREVSAAEVRQAAIEERALEVQARMERRGRELMREQLGDARAAEKLSWRRPARGAPPVSRSPQESPLPPAAEPPSDGAPTRRIAVELAGDAWAWVEGQCRHAPGWTPETVIARLLQEHRARSVFVPSPALREKLERLVRETEARLAERLDFGVGAADRGDRDEDGPEPDAGGVPGGDAIG